MATTKRPPFVHPTEVAAAALGARGSLNEVANGHVQKMGHTEAWDMGQEWVGRELIAFRHKESLWDRSIRVTFMCQLNAENKTMPVFTLSLHPPLTKEEIERSAECHLVLLNLMRKES